MWTPITKEEYAKEVNSLSVIESFSDPTGESPMGRGFPWMETIWGTDGKRILKVITSKSNVDQEQWDNHYFKSIHSYQDDAQK